MAKVGLKDTLTLLAKGYTKKDIDALAAIDEEQEAPAPDKKAPEAPAPAEDKKAQDDAADKESNPEPDYKQLYEDLKKQSEADKATITKLQQDNVHKNNAPAAAEQKKQEADALTALVRSYM